MPRLRRSLNRRPSPNSKRRSRHNSARRLESLESRHLLTAAGLVISEFMASNDGTLVDAAGNTPDWVEIHNPTSAPVSMQDWYLSDDEQEPQKWPFPASTLAAGEYLLVYASGRSTTDFVGDDGIAQTNFKLSKQGEWLGLSYAPTGEPSQLVDVFAPEYPTQYEDISYGRSGSVVTDTLIAAGDTARYLVPTNGSVDNTWTDVAFDDSGWDQGATGLGYENSPADYADLLRTHVPRGTDNAYLRMRFDIDNPADLEALTLRMQYDDGFAVYLNGSSQPVFTRNAPNSLDFRSVATANHQDADAVQFQQFDLTNQLGRLRSGTNVLAIHALNQRTSSDMLIRPELLATRTSTAEQSTVGYFAQATPGGPNTASIANPGPAIRDVTENPGALPAGQALPITAQVSPLATEVQTVTLHYRAMYGVERTIAMRDDGQAGDTQAGDGIYTATIPAGTASAGQMLRWYVTATDAEQQTSRAPTFFDSTGNGQSAEYFGTVVQQNSNTQLPQFQWFTQNESASHTRSGTRASVFYAGRFYDNIFVRRRGGATNSSQSQKFDFNSGEKLWVNDTIGKVGEINLNGNGSDPSYLRQTMGFDLHTAAGGASSFTDLVLMQLNGQFDRVGVWIEQVDDDFLDRQDYDPDGDLYKLVQRSNLQPALSDTSTGVEKKTGDRSELTTFAELVDGVRLSTQSQRRNFLYDNLDLPQFINYMAVRSLQHQADDVRKNMYLYQDAQGDELWRIYPWDLDWTFNIVGGHDNQDSQRTEHPFFGTRDHPTADGANQWNRLYEAMFENAEIRSMYLRRLRTLMDTFYRGRSGTETWFEEYINREFPEIDPHLGSSVTSGKNSLLNSVQDRRRELYDTYTRRIPGYTEVIPAAQANIVNVAFGAHNLNDAADNPTTTAQQQYLTLHNPNAVAVDLSGWQLSGAVTHTLPPGTVLAPGMTMYLTPNLTEFRQRTNGPSGGQALLVQEWDSGPASRFDESIALQDAGGRAVAELSYSAAPSLVQQFLRVSEIYYHPPNSNSDAGEPDGPDQQFEFIELVNASDTHTLQLEGVSFAAGVQFTFGNEALAPGETILVAANAESLAARFGDAARVAGTFMAGTNLDNGGERLTLRDQRGHTILSFRYDDQAPWPESADGDGDSLVPQDLGAGIDASGLFGDPANWLAQQPSPGQWGETRLPGDADGNGRVDFTDFLVFSRNFGKTDAVFADGDFNDDRTIDFADFLILAQNFGRVV